MAGQGGPTFSVIVTTHHRPRELRAALLSLRAQDFRDFRIVLAADEGSRATKDVASDLLRDEDAFLVLPGARGPAETRNAAMSVATGAWLTFLDDDDLWRPDYLGRLAAALPDEPAIVHCDYAVWRGFNHEFDAARADLLRPVATGRAGAEARLHVANFIAPHSFAVPRAAVGAVRFDPRLETHEDWDFLLHLLHATPLRLRHVAMSGPVLCLPDRPSRNRGTDLRRSHLLDRLAICRRWRADAGVAAARAATFRRFGLAVAESLL